MCTVSAVCHSATSWTGACQASLSMEFSRQEYWSGLPFPSLGDLPNPRTTRISGGQMVLSTEPPGQPKNPLRQIQKPHLEDATLIHKVYLWKASGKRMLIYPVMNRSEINFYLFWTWIWANSGRWWRTGKAGVLQSTGSKRARQDLATEQQ